MILVTGASGNVGGAVLNELLGLGVPVRAMYRSESDASKAPAGADRVIADFSDRGSLDRALEGVDRVFLVCSPIPKLVELETNMVEACRAHRIQSLVQNSALGAGETKASFSSWHFEVEECVRASGVPATILRPESFTQNILNFYVPTIRTQGKFYAALQDAPIAYIDVRDIAAIAARVLTSGQHSGRTYVLTGPELLTQRKLAQKISELTGQTVEYVDLLPAQLRQSMVEQGTPPWLAGALVELQAYYTDGPGAAVTGDVRRVSGRDPRAVDDFLKEHAESFGTRPGAA
jgi:uncharacterized protein YbjT (DUF2867 family)